MNELVIAFTLGGACGILGILAYRFRLAWLGWLTLAPLTAAVYLSSPIAAGLAGFVCGALIVGSGRQVSVPGVVRGARFVEAIISGLLALFWGLVCALAAWLWPDGVPAWGVVIMPTAAIALSSAMPLGLAIFSGPYRLRRPPYYWSWFLGSQAGALPVVHIARLGSDLIIPALLALAATAPVLLLVQLPPSGATVAVAITAILVVAGALGFGFASYRRAVGRVKKGESLRVAAVAVDPVEFDPNKTPEYRDVDGTIARYQPHVAHAIAHGARLIVLPEYAVIVTAQNRPRWLAAVGGWAREAKAWVVVGLSEDLQTDELVIADETGQIVATYAKQRPVPFLEPKPKQRTPPALLERDPFPVSAVVCVDLDYPEVVQPVARAGGVLAVPAKDWEEIVDMHRRSAVWTAVMSGVPLVRSAGHGISAVYDAAGRVVAQANSLDGPVVLVADVPIAPRGYRGVPVRTVGSAGANT